jgi:hypothetical protein
MVIEYSSEVLDLMEKVVIPEIDLRDSAVPDVVRILNDVIAKAEAGKKDQRLPIVLALPVRPEKENEPGGSHETSEMSRVPRITLQARNISLLEAVKIVCNVCDLKWRLEGRRIVIMPLAIPEARLVVRTHHVGTNFLDGFRGTNTTSNAESGPWPVCRDLSAWFVTDRRWPPLPAMFCPTSGILTRVMWESEVPFVEDRLRNASKERATNAVKEGGRAPGM